MNKLEKRMYGLVPYNLSPIQQGIQFTHGVVEGFIYFEGQNLEKLKDWAINWKTVIILNGGTTNNGIHPGTLNQHIKILKDNDIPFSYFHEHDLGDQLTSINFIVDERVFNKEKYPDFIHDKNDTFDESLFKYETWLESIGGTRNEFLRTFLEQFKLA